MNTEVPNYSTDSDIPIPESGTWPAAIHWFDEKSAAALRAAEATGRPLLVRGMPGVGKSQTARAAAAAAKRPFLSVVIDGRTEPHDLMWRFDAVRRLGDAQIKSQEGKISVRGEISYVVPQALWWAYDWNGAKNQLRNCIAADNKEEVAPDGWEESPNRAVLLIDEIDKADPDLPNALLEVLANKGFRVPFSGEYVRCSDQTRPLVVITTNEERELPNAFLRRCMVLTLELPADDKLPTYLEALGDRHQNFLIETGRRTGRCLVMAQAARVLVEARKAAREGEYVPGTSEYLDLVGALATLWPDDAVQQDAQLELLSQFALKKSPQRG